MKYKWETMTEQQKIKATQQEIWFCTHNGTTKDDLLNILRWLWDKFEVTPKQKHLCAACGGSGNYKDGKCGACDGTGKEKENDNLFSFLSKV